MVTQSFLKEILHYDLSTGVFTWKVRDSCHFNANSYRSALSSSLSWNNRYSGKRAGCSSLYASGPREYIKIKKKAYFSYRLAWLYVYGKFPNNQIDHINGDPSDNRIVNLRDVTSLENSRNSSSPKSNTSGRVGVSFRKDRNKWRAFINENNKHIHIGYYLTMIDAICERIRYEKQLGFHANHGKVQPWPSKESMQDN
jgi:hypothetical protein